MEDATLDIELLKGALENVLGKLYKKSKGNYATMCPFCHHHKAKLEINLNPNSPNFGCWNCWVCHTRGRSIKSLLKHLNLPYEQVKSVLQFVKIENQKEGYGTVPKIITLPEEFQPLSNPNFISFEAKRARGYLYARGLTDNDFIKYNIGYCTEGKYADSVIIPSYDSNNCLNYFISRSLDQNAFQKYKNPDIIKDKIIFWENLINWNKSIILVEGVFDGLAVRRNCVPLLGKFISSALMTKIIENPVPEIYIALDSDALKAALNHCETFLNMGKKVYLVRPEAKDPSDEGFERFTQQLQQAKELTFADLISYKVNFNL